MDTCKTHATSRRPDRLRRAGLVAGAFALPALGARQPEPNFGQSAVSDGVRFEYGLAPETLVAAHPAGHAEAEMHGSVLNAPGATHVTLAAFDAKTGSRIGDASATVDVSGPGHPGRVSVPLEPMNVAGGVTYGGYVTLQKDATYHLAFTVKRPAGSARAVFEAQAPQGD